MKRLWLHAILAAALIASGYTWYSADRERKAEAQLSALRCDLETADPMDPAKSPDVPGVDDASIDQFRAADFCRRAVELNPDHPRYHYQFGRAYWKKTLHSSAFVEFETAAQADYPAAMHALGRVYEIGYGSGQHYDKALHWYRQAAKRGIYWSSLYAANMIDGGRGTVRDPQGAAEHVFAAIEEADQKEDVQIIRLTFEELRWNQDFWKDIQLRLTATGGYRGQIDGQASAETRRAMESLARQ